MPFNCGPEGHVILNSILQQNIVLYNNFYWSFIHSRESLLAYCIFTHSFTAMHSTNDLASSSTYHPSFFFHPLSMNRPSITISEFVAFPAFPQPLPHHQYLHRDPSHSSCPLSECDSFAYV